MAKTKKSNRLLAMLLAFVMVLGLVPTAVMTTATAAGDASPTVGDYLYFGTWGIDGETFPIKWRVLDADSTNMGASGGIYLMSEYLLGDSFTYDDSSNAWDGSNAQTWVQEFSGQLSSTTYVPADYGLSTEEAEAVLSTSISDSAATVNGVSYGARTMTEKVFFLSAQETVDYLAYDNSGACDSTIAYKVASGGAAGSAGSWWLRSPSASISRHEGYVSSSGGVYNYYVDSNYCARPALNLNLASCFFASDITGAAGAGDEKLVFVPMEGESNAWRLATEDEMTPPALTGTVSISGTAAYGNTLTASVSGSNNTGTLSYQWKRGSTNVGTNSESYTVDEADIGDTLTCTVTSSVQSGSVTSAATAIVTKAAAPAAPAGLTGNATSVYGGNDGSISGVTTAMEYKLSGDSSYTACTGTSITGLSAGTYLVRYAETSTTFAGGDATVTVANAAATVSSIKVSSSDHKTAYTVGDTLDVTGLTIEATWTDSNTTSVNVAAGMVSGFNSDTATASQTLTITYEGQTTTYVISVTAPEPPAAPTGLGFISPTTSGGSDGTITGVDDTMEWDDNESFNSPTSVSGTTIENLSAGTYYVRVKASGNIPAGSYATVVVPDAQSGSQTGDYTVKVETSKTTVYAGETITVTVNVDSETADYVGIDFRLTWDSTLFAAPEELPDNWLQKTGYLQYTDENTSKSEDYTVTLTALAQTELKTETFDLSSGTISVSRQNALDGVDTQLTTASSETVTIALKNVDEDTVDPDEDPTGEETGETVGDIGDSTANIDYKTTVTYDGQVHNFPVPTLSDTTAIAGGSKLTLAYSDSAEGTYTATTPEAKTDAGTYTVYYKGTITGFAQEISGTLTLQIDKKDITNATVTLDETELTYTGSEQTVDVTSVTIDGLTVPVADYTVSENVKTDAGKYSAQAAITSDSSNFTGTATAVWEIISSDDPLGTDGNEITVVPVDSLEYNGQAQDLTVTLSANAPADAVVTYATTLRGSYSETPLTGTDADDYTVYYEVNSANWTEPVSGKFIATITPKDINITVEAKTKLVGMADPELTYAFDDTQLCGTDTEEGLGIHLTRAAGETVGEYTISGRIENGNYAATFSAANLTISALTLAADDIAADADPAESGETTTGGNDADTSTDDNLVFNYTTTVEYDGKVHSFPVPTLVDEDAIEAGAVLKLTYCNTETGTYTADVPTQRTNAGAYTVYYKGEITGFSQTISGTLTLEITKKDISGATITLSETDAELEYTGQTQTMGVTSVVIDGITVPASEYAVSGNKGTTATDYTLTVTANTDSQNFTGSQTAAWKIVGGTGSATVAPSTDIVYNGRDQELSAKITDVPDDATITYSETEDGNYTSTVPTGKAADVYTVYYTITSANWSEALKGSYEVTIAPKAISVTINAAEKYVGEADPSFTHQTVNGLAAGDTEESLGVSLARLSGETAGTYAINGSVSNTNYSATFVEADLTIKAAAAGSEYFVEIVNAGNSTYGKDYATGWSLVLVYTDKEMAFNYDGELMLDVTDSEYKYNNTTTYTYVYGFVVKGAATADKVTIANAGSTPTVVTYDYDVNSKEGLTIGDVVAAFASRDLVDVTVSASNMSAVLKSDVNKDKVVDGYDVNLVKTEYTKD